MLTIKKLTKAHAGRTLFAEAEMVVNWGERIALVGPNGAGKSTLFRMILGQDTPDEGEIVRDEYALVGYLPQEAGDPSDRTVLEIAMSTTPEMGQAIRTITECEAKGDQSSDAYAQAMDTFIAHDGYQLEPKAKRILKGLAFKDEDFHRPAREMSGGWVMRAHLAQLLVAEPDLLMLDEPTNHLDLMSLLWFQRYLKNYPGAILMISHDRDFMDELVEYVYDIESEQLVRYTGNYTTFLQLKEQRYELLLAAWRNQQREIAHIESFIDRFRSVASKAAQVQSRVKQLEKMQRIEKPKQSRKVFKFIFPQPPRSMQRVIELEKVGQSYGEKRIYKNLDLLVERGERIVLVGPNGAGKSTLLKILAGVVPIDEGKRTLGTTTRIGYFSQMRSENLTPNYTVLEEIMKADPELREEEARGILGSFLFRRLDVEKRVEVLSGGEKSRLSLVKFLVNPPNLLLMDEPTTHLDLMSVEALSQALKRYEGTLVFISHDVHFIRSLAEKTLHINQGVLTPYAGGYDYYLEKSGLLDADNAMDL
ncbi:MAG: ABC-F family ATP-binding cassette domain-containing protein [Akkermansiaceae bacterium]|nr:ABC-F family ATP-binding cassette domain-containing protein [Akkermansiaceae bacterium]